MLVGKRAIQPDADGADLLALGGQVLHGGFGGLAAGAHDDHHTLGLLVADIIEEMVLPLGDLGELIHRGLHDGRRGRIVWIDRLPGLEVHIRVLRRAAQDRMLRRQRPCAMSPDQVFVDQGAQLVVRQLEDLGDLVRGAEAVKEVHERHTRLQGGGLRNGREVMGFLHGPG